MVPDANKHDRYNLDLQRDGNSYKDDAPGSASYFPTNDSRLQFKSSGQWLHLLQCHDLQRPEHPDQFNSNMHHALLYRVEDAGRQ